MYLFHSLAARQFDGDVFCTSNSDGDSISDSDTLCWVLILVLSQGEIVHLELAIVCCQQFLNLWCHLALPFGWYQGDIIKPGTQLCSVEDETWATSIKTQPSQDSGFQSSLLFLGGNLHFSPKLFKLSIYFWEKNNNNTVMWKRVWSFIWTYRLVSCRQKAAQLGGWLIFAHFPILPTTNFNV